MSAHSADKTNGAPANSTEPGAVPSVTEQERHTEAGGLRAVVERIATCVVSGCRVGIGMKVALLVCVSVLATTVAVTSMMSQRFGKALVDEELQTLTTTSQTAAARMSMQMATLAEDVLFVAGTPPIQGIIRAQQADGVDPWDGSSGELWKTRLETILQMMLNSKAHYVRAECIRVGEDGQEIVRVDRNRRPAGVARDENLEVKAHSDYVRRAAELARGEVYISDVTLSREHGQIEQPSMTVMRAATPVCYGDGIVWGVVVIDVDMSVLFADAQQDVAAGRTLLVANQAGRYLWHPKPRYRPDVNRENGWLMQDDLPDVASFIDAPDVKSTAIIYDDGTQTTAVGLCRVTCSKVKNAPHLIMATTTPVSQIVAPFQHIRHQTMRIAAVMTAGCLVIGLLFARTVTRPLNKIAVAAHAFAEGDDTVGLPLRARDETGDLARALEQMRQQIKVKTDRLQQQVMRRAEAEKACLKAHECLERRVADRTSELEAANRDLGEFAYIASHDLKEPLRMVASYTELLADEYRGQLSDQADRYIQFATDGAKRMQALIDDLLTYFSIRNVEAIGTTIDLNELVDEVVASLDLAIGENDALVEVGELPVVSGSRSFLTQLFQNLISNAVKFHGSRAPRVRVYSEEQDGERVFAVSDDGIGIPAEQHERVFQMFQRLHGRGQYEGTGIGLPICRKVIERHGGRIWIVSTPGHGTTFYFTLAAKYLNTKDAIERGVFV